MIAMLNHVTTVLFFISTLTLMAACVVQSNRMSGSTGNWFKVAMILVIIGSAGQWMLAAYHLIPQWCMLCSIPISLGISAFLFWNKRSYDANFYLFRRG